MTLWDLRHLFNRIQIKMEHDHNIRDVSDYEILYSTEAGDRNKCLVSVAAKWIQLPSIIDGEVNIIVR